MARLWLRKSELNEKLWKGESVLEPSVGGYCRTALSAESLAKMLLLVVVNSVFLLAALHVLHSKREFESSAHSVHDRSADCLNNVYNSMPLPAVGQERRMGYTPVIKSRTSSSILKVPVGINFQRELPLVNCNHQLKFDDCVPTWCLSELARLFI